MNNDRVKVDFRPLYQCLHIHDVMGQKASFRAHYEENRKLQANLVLSAPFSLSEADVSGFEAYLQDIIGVCAMRVSLYALVFIYHHCV